MRSSGQPDCVHRTGDVHPELTKKRCASNNRVYLKIRVYIQEMCIPEMVLSIDKNNVYPIRLMCI